MSITTEKIRKFQKNEKTMFFEIGKNYREMLFSYFIDGKLYFGDFAIS